MTKKDCQYVFTIRGICTEDVDIKYGIINRDDSNKMEVDDTTKGVTRLTDLNKDNRTPCTLTFLGDSKQLHKCNVSMIDHTTNTNVNMLNYSCFWCRHPFSTVPIGCPISYIPRKLSRKYVSVMNQNNYEINEDTLLEKLEGGVENVTLTSDEPYYQTDGIFCSFNCCTAFINDNKTKQLYFNSYMLLVKMYNDMFKKPITKIMSAPDWRLLKQYGGHLSISEFRSSFDNSEYKSHGTMRDVKMVSVGTLYEKKLKF